MKVIGLISLKDPAAFEQYRNEVGATIERFGGKVLGRGTPKHVFWNELEVAPFDAFVEIAFPDQAAAQRWAQSPEYLSLIPIRSQAMALTLIAID